MRTVKSLSKRLIALTLSIIMVLGMIPTGVWAEEGSAGYGAVEALSEGVTITGSGEATVNATYAGTLHWIEKDENVGRMEAGWWAGIKVIAPAGVDLEKATYTGGGEPKLFADFVDGTNPHYIELWRLIKPEYLRDANLTDGLATYTTKFDWNGDGTDDQTVYLHFDADQTVLVNDTTTTVYPEATIGFGAAESLTSGAAVSGSGTANVSLDFNEKTTFDWVAADHSVGRYQDGWWAGMKITAPEDMTEEQVKNVNYMSGTTVKSFWKNKDSQEGDKVHYITMWIPLNGLISGNVAPFTYKFDWNNDGIFEQNVVMSVDASKVTLTQNGAQVYPVLGQVSSYNGGAVTGSGTSNVVVTVNNATIDWSPADAALGRNQGWWVGIKIEAPAGMSREVLQNAVYQSKSGPNNDWSGNKSFWNNKDSEAGADAHFIGMWFPVSPASIEKFKAEDRNITTWYQFDWDNDGDFEQQITFEVDPNGNIVLNKVDQTEFGFAVETPADLWIGEPTYQNVASGGQGDGAITYAIIDGDAATIDAATGELTFAKVGTVTVQATKAADSEGYYNEITAEYTITAVKKDQTPKFAIAQPGAITYVPGLTFENEVVDVLGGTVKYEIVEGNAASIDEETGKLTIIKAGTVVVNAKITGSALYNDVDVQSYTLVVNKADQSEFAFLNAPTELTWQAVAIDAIELQNGLGDGKVTWTIVDGDDVASVAANGKITLLKAGNFTIQAQKAGDDCYNDSSAISATVLVNKAEQSDFGFGETKEATVTYNDNGNRYTLTVTGGQSSKKVVYTVISGTAATVDANGVVTVEMAGEVEIKATKPSDDQYKEISDTFVLTINPDIQDISFKDGNTVNVYYGTTEYTNPIVFGDEYSADGQMTYMLAENDIGASIDPATGKISFEDSEKKVGTLEVTATKAADECYKLWTDSYILNVSYLTTESEPAVSGDKLNESVWYTGNVNIEAPEGFVIGTDNKLSSAWSDKVSFYEEGADKTAKVYLKNTAGYITDVIEVKGIYTDTVNPQNLKIEYATPYWEVFKEALTFGLYNSELLEVTISAEDTNSGIASLTYNIGGEDVVVLFNGEKEATSSFVINAEYRNKIAFTATDMAGRQSKLEDEIVVVLDTENPDITAAYEYASGNYRDYNGIYYTQKDTTITFTIDESNFDLSGLEIQKINGEDAINGEKTGVPVVKVNDEEQNVTWNRVENTTQWAGQLTLSGNGDYVVTVDFTDPAQNVMETYSKEVHIDETKPLIAVAYDNDQARNGNYYKADRAADVQITAHNFEPMEVKLTVNAKDVNISSKAYADYAKNPANWSNAGDVWTLDPAGMKFDIDAFYTITIEYTDLAANTADAYTAEFVIDKTKPDDIKIEYSTGVIDKILEFVTFGLYKFYKSDVIVRVTAEDVTAGVEYFEITYTQNDGANNDNKVSYTTEKIEAKQDPTNKNVYTATHTITANARGKVSVKVVDKAGNDNAKYDDVTLVADKIAPGLDVAYIFTDNQKREYNNIYYTKGETKVRFTVDEANFDLALLTAVGETANKAPVATVNDVAQDVSWTQIDGTNKWVGEITLTGNGDYVVGLTFVDRSTNEMQSFAKEIRIDNAAPVFEVTYDNNTARNTNKFKDDRIAAIQITEHNFKASEVKLTVEAMDITETPVDISSKGYADYAKDPSKWSNVGDVWVLDSTGIGMKFDTDAIYSVTLEYTDLAENVAEIYTTEFVIDKTDATNIGIEYSTPLLRKALETVTFGFYQAGVDVTLTAEDMTAGVEYFELTYTKQDDTSDVNAETFTTEPLKATQSVTNKKLFTTASYNIPAQARGNVSVLVMDQAGNDTTGSNPDVVVVDTVNPTREVSYTPYKILDKATMLKVDEYKEGDNSILYYKDDAVVTFKITEANFDLSLKDDETKPVIKVNNTSVDVEWTQSGDTWTATHTISGDGDYVVTMTYKDLSTNQMVNYESCKIAIDRVAPVVSVKYADGTPTQTIDGNKYYKSSQTVAVQITDHNFRADDVVVDVTAKDVQDNAVDISSKAYADYAKNRANWTSKGDVHTLNTAGMVFDIDAIYTFDISYDDICDNVAADYAEDNFVVDHAAPTNLNIVYKTPVTQRMIQALTFGFFKSKVTVVLSADDANAGVDFFDWTYTKQADTSDKNAEDHGAKIAAEDITYSNNGMTATASFTIPAQARGYISATVTDRAGNAAEKIDDTVINVVDNIAPAVSVSYEASKSNTAVQFIDAENATVDSFEKAAKAYYNGNVKVKIVIDEANFFEGITTEEEVIHQVGIKLTKTDNEGNKTVFEYLPEGAAQKYEDAKAKNISWTTKGDVHTCVISYTDNADYVLEIECVDLSTNAAKIASNDGQTATKTYVSKTVTVDKIAPVIDVTYGNTNVINTVGGREYFDKAQSAVITVTEHNFRASDVKAAVAAVNFRNAKVSVADFAAQLADEENWNHDGDVHTAEVSYTVDANYTFDIDYMDLGKNASADYSMDLFTVDTTAPTKPTVSYSQSVFQQILDRITFGYYNTTVKVTLTADDAISGIHRFDYSYINADDVSEVNAELLDQAIKAAKIKHEKSTGIATFSIPKSALTNKTQFNGRVEFTAYDRSENSTHKEDSTRIIVDNISPTATVTYNAPVQNENEISYYNGNIEATIVINEANFDSRDVVVTVTREGANYPVNVTWVNNSVDIHTGTFVLTEDGDYVVSIQYRDKSGNQMNPYTSNQLTLDTTAPTIRVTEIVANSANKDEEYGFEITFDDTNLDVNSMNPVLLALLQNKDGVYASTQIDLGNPVAVAAGQTYTYSVENLTEDALYTLSYEVADMAGNTTTNATFDDGEDYVEVQFSINRNGSAFGFGNDFTENLVSQYYVYGANEDVVIVEVNVDPIENYVVELNGVELVEGRDYTTDQTSGNGEWSKRSYFINKDLFASEGEYSIIVTSIDKAENTAYSDIKNLSVTFVVDKTAPVVTISGLANGGRYQTDLQTVTLMPSDEGGRLNNLKVVVMDSDGKALKDDNGDDISLRFEMSGDELLAYLEANDGKVTFTIPEGLNNQVQIICNDCAVNANGGTNEYNETFTKVTVSQQQLVIFYANTPVFLATVAGVIGVAAVVIVLLKRKKTIV